jgi:hypothetical protein
MLVEHTACVKQKKIYKIRRTRGLYYVFGRATTSMAREWEMILEIVW